VGLRLVSVCDTQRIPRERERERERERVRDTQCIPASHAREDEETKKLFLRLDSAWLRCVRAGVRVCGCARVRACMRARVLFEWYMPGSIGDDGVIIRHQSRGRVLGCGRACRGGAFAGSCDIM